MMKNKKDDKVKRIVALNDDSKDAINDNYKDKSLDDTLELLITLLIDKGVVEDGNIDVIIYSKWKTKQ